MLFDMNNSFTHTIRWPVNKGKLALYPYPQVEHNIAEGTLARSLFATVLSITDSIPTLLATPGARSPWPSMRCDTC